MNATTEKFMKESGITRRDDWTMDVPGTSGINLYITDDCSPSELLVKIIKAGEHKRSKEIFNLLTRPE